MGSADDAAGGRMIGTGSDNASRCAALVRFILELELELELGA